MNPIEIIDYTPEHQAHFERLNREWIERLFGMEPLDEWVLTNPAKAILEPGGAILIATYDGVIVGTAGLRKLDEFSFEFTKMSVDKNFRRKGIAEAICYACFRKAKALGARKIILYSNKKNVGAVPLYEKVGFSHVPVENNVYKRADVKMMIDIQAAIENANKHDQLIQL